MARRDKIESVDLEALNKGFKMKTFQVGDWVKVYKVPYRATRLDYEGEIIKITYVGRYGVMAEVLPQGKEHTRFEYLYAGKIYNPYA